MYLAETTAAQGNLHRASEMFQQLRQYAQKHHLGESATFSGVLIGLGLLHYEWNEMAAAEELIRSGRQLAESGKSIDRLLQACCATVKIHLAKDKFPDIETRLDYIEKVAAEHDYPLLVMDRLDALRSLQALRKGDQQSAARWAHLYAQRYQNDVVCTRQLEWEAVAQIWLKTTNEKSGIAILRQLQQLAQNETRQRDWVSITASLVDALNQGGELEQALSELSALLVVAEPEGYLRAFVEKGKGMKGLLERLLKRNGSSSPRSTYIEQILNSFLAGKGSSQTLRILTPRELEVVTLLGEGLTYAQIHTRLTITENTLKTHIKRIYSKLQVHNRVQAVLVAQEKGLL